MQIAHDVIPHGFRGDLVLLQAVDALVLHAKIHTFIETGSFYGMTTRHMASSYPHLACYSCEPDKFRYKQAQLATLDLPNCTLTNEESPHLLERLIERADAVQQPTLFWLDAHGYGFNWPLRREIELIVKYWNTPYILIDDFKVPDCEQFGYDVYDAQECSYDYIADLLNMRTDLRIWYPNYDPQTVDWPARGWCLITFNRSSKMDCLIEAIV
jgi:hypothetical protein